MTRAEVLNSYDVIGRGSITSPGKFEGEMLYVPAMWESTMHGGGDADFGSVQFVIFTDEDRKEFPEIGPTYGMAMEESEQGFIYTEEYETKAEYDAAVERMENAEAE
jgi:hypothetical protein